MDLGDLFKRLKDPFPVSEVRWKAQTVSDKGASGARCLAVPYVNARTVMDRLDDVLGADNWRDEYRPLDGGAVVCRLALRLGGEWVAKEDVGGESEQPDEGDKAKAAFSDSLKRAAVKWGVARYLGRLPKAWVDYDKVRKCPASTPALPPWALPSDGPPQVAPSAARVKPAAKKAKGFPADGAEGLRRLRDKEALLVQAGACKAGELVAQVKRRLAQAGFGDDPLKWAGPAWQVVAEEVRAFEAKAERDRAEGAEERAAVQTGQ